MPVPDHTVPNLAGESQPHSFGKKISIFPNEFVFLSSAPHKPKGVAAR
jgi:hypothetical protein